MSIPILGPLVNLIGEGVKGWFGHKQAVTQAKRDKELAHIAADGETDTASAHDMKTSWKDEYLVILFSTPMIVVFYASVWGDPEDVERVKTAFAAMKELPEWYLYCMVGIVIGTFGLRALARKMMGGKSG